MTETNTAPEAPAPSADTGAYAGEDVRPLKNRFTPLKWVVIAYMAGEAGLFVANAGEMYYRSIGIDVFAVSGPDDMAAWGVVLTAAVFGIVQVISLLASYVLVSLWTYRAMKNLHIVGEPHAEMKPGWAVGWYFIPFANLVKPFQGMTEIWRGSHHQAGEPEKVASFVGWWWALWLISNVLSNIAVRLGGILEEGEAYELSLWFFGASSAASFVCAWLLLKTTGRITLMQERLRAGMADVFA